MSRVPQEQVVRTLRRVVPPALALIIVGLTIWALKPAPPPTVVSSRPEQPYAGVELVHCIAEPSMEPWGLAAGEENRLLVTDRKTNSLLIFDQHGTLLHSSGTIAGQENLLKEPAGVCWEQHTRRAYVADAGHDRVVAFSHEGRFLFAFGEHGEEKGTFHRPVGIATDQQGTLYVVQVDDARLQTFSLDGVCKTVTTAAELGMDYLWGVACLADGGLALSSALGGLTMYDGDYKPLASLANRGIGPGCYLFTTGIAVDEQGRVLVCGKTQGKVMLIAPPTSAEPRGVLLAEICSTDGPDYQPVSAPLLAAHGTMAARRTVNEHLQHTLRYPMDVTFLPARRLAIAERGNGRVLVFKERQAGQ